MDEHGSSSDVAKEQKGHIPISGNLAYGQVKREGGVGDSEYAIILYLVLELVPVTLFFLFVVILHSYWSCFS